MNKEKARLYQRRWYEKQKNNGLIYLLEFANGETYVGKTKNSLKKRLWQHRAGSVLKTSEQDFSTCTATVLHKCKREEDLTTLERRYITELAPTLNYVGTHKTKRTAYWRRRGIEYEGIWFPTKKRLWETKGTCCYSTFKSRLRRGKTLQQALS
jgi:predicted GIY-YIG superfamily endonuclease